MKINKTHRKFKEYSDKVRKSPKKIVKLKIIKRILSQRSYLL